MKVTLAGFANIVKTKIELQVQQVARVEGQEVFKALAERFPNLEVATTELEYQPSVTFRSLKSLPVTWH